MDLDSFIEDLQAMREKQGNMALRVYGADVLYGHTEVNAVLYNAIEHVACVELA
jgi:hypothetical protein